MRLELINILDPIFSKNAEPIMVFDNDLKKLSDDIFQVMYENDAIGLTAVHIGVPKQIAVIDLEGKLNHPSKNSLVLVNPKIIYASENKESVEEGSVAIFSGNKVIVERPKKIKVEYQDLEGNKKELEADGLLARCIQHEMDHFSGKTILDYLSEEEKNDFIEFEKKYLKKLEGLKKMKETGLKMVYATDPRIKTIAEPVIDFNDKLTDFVDKMFTVMYAEDGIGLAAVQVGVPKRVIVIDIPTTETNEKGEIISSTPNPIVVINPEILWTSDNLTELEEGCLSVPENRVIVKRPDKIKVKFYDLKGNEKIVEADGLLAKCFQHEIDHLNGKTIVDYLSKLKKDTVLKKIKKIVEKNG